MDWKKFVSETELLPLRNSWADAARNQWRAKWWAK